MTVGDVPPSRQEIARRIASVSVGRLRRPVLVRGMDGAYGPTRPDSARAPDAGHPGTRARQGRDAKGVRFSLLDGERLVHALSWQQVHALFPEARQGLDSSHCAQDLHRVAKAPEDSSGQAFEWVEATMTRLSLGQVGLVLGGLKRMQAQSDEAANAMANG